MTNRRTLPRVLALGASTLLLGATVAAAQSTASPAAVYPLGLLLPDSEFVYGPTLFNWDTQLEVAEQAGFLASYTEVVGGEILSGADIVDLVAMNRSIGPRMLLALVEMHSGWVSSGSPKELDFPVGEPLPGLRPGLELAAAALNRHYYAFRRAGQRSITLSDGTSIELTNTNAATFALLAYLSRTATRDTWAGLEAASRFHMAWTSLFGDPYVYKTTVVLPPALPEVTLRLPFPPGEVWYYVAGPHSPAGPDTPRAAIDFAPPPENLTGCHLSVAWVTAAAGGVVARSRGSEVVVDLDGDGFVGSGWTHVYRHLADFDRVAEGTKVKAGDVLGHPSCDASETTLTRVSFARKYNGEWIPVDDATAPLIMDGWAVLPGPEPRTGWLARAGVEPRAAGPTKVSGVNGVATLPR